MEKSGGLYTDGTNGGLLSLSLDGGLPTRNFQDGHFEGAEKITGATITKTILTNRGNCFGCPVRCKREVTTKTPGMITDPNYGGPEYETVGALGSCCGIDDLDAISYANQLCNAYSLDTIATGVSIAFAMEAYEKGLITKKETGGLDLRFGNAAAMVKCVEMIGKREGFGDFLAEGVYRMSKEIGKGSEAFAMQIKGQEVPMHEPRIKYGLGIGYATSPTGADHVHNIHDTGYTKDTGSMRAAGVLEPLPYNDLSPAKVRLLLYVTNWQILTNSLGLCTFLPYDFHQVREITNAVIGWNTSLWELLKVGERGHALARAFNAREGFTSEDDYLPRRFFEPLGSDTPAMEGVAIEEERFKKALITYYGMAGWDPATGTPIRERLEELD
ncbi:MAG: aldehyde ferredoxin oxidoreductase C-terminal domain-containing protein, partial [Chloroflexota bacterium]|nr:aldehyde ferredoxin oxidoreductase C-terminal domain-containing protein [Chloroflexota bacterium]